MTKFKLFAVSAAITASALIPAIAQAGNGWR